MDVDVPVTCPNCRRKLTKKISWLKAHPKFDCACGTRISFRPEDIAAGARKAADIGKAIDKLFRK